MLSKHHQKYLAHLLTKVGGEGIDKLSQSLFNANVDLNPHQVEAALFALRTPFTNGVILADEVGLGKTIEAGLVIAQYVAEHKRKILIISPASLRKQWAVELEEKFNLESDIFDAREYKRVSKEGYINPFMKTNIVIASYHFVARKAEDIRAIDWDLVVIDEAHKLRNSHRQSNKIGQALRWATEDKRKILLTATPLQNSITELYGISGVIDDKIFGDFSTFRTLYANADGDLYDLKSRIAGFCHRSLRKDVIEFIRFTQRKLITIDYSPSEEEALLYVTVSNFLQREDTYSFPKQQKHLIVLIVRKVLSSSFYALSETLISIKNRLVSLRDEIPVEEDFVTALIDSVDIDEEYLEDYEDYENRDEDKKIDRKKLNSEIEEVERLILWAKSLGIDTKTKSLIQALSIGYAELEKVGANKKAVIFTESKRTLVYLQNYLESNGYLGKICTYSGSNNDTLSRKIYQEWLNKNSDKIVGSKSVNMRHAILDFFENEAQIMISTEAGAEGLNLQFCSLLINFDLPWNPQRIEQRIGRIHRYGQRFDIVVINFLNRKNAADKRVYDLLRYKFNLFEGIFGSSDEILGQIEKASNIEARISAIYQNCRTEKEIEEQFNNLQKELEEIINSKIETTKQKLFENFDEEVHRKIKIEYNDALNSLDEFGRDFWRLTRANLDSCALFDEDKLTFQLHKNPLPQIKKGKYYLPSKRNQEEQSGKRYTLDTDLGKYCLESAKNLILTTDLVSFNLTEYPLKISALEQFQGQTGYLLLSKLTIESIEKEEYLLFSGFTSKGEDLEQAILQKMFRLDSQKEREISIPEEVNTKLISDNRVYAETVVRKSLETNNSLFLERRDMLYRWAEDVVEAAERKLQDVKKELRLAEREAGNCKTLVEQKQAQENIKTLEKKKRATRNKIYETEDMIADKRNILINELEKKMAHRKRNQVLFMIKWEIN